MLSHTPFLLVDGNCAEAMALYHSCLGGQLTVTRLGDTPMKTDVPSEHHQRVVYAHLKSSAVEFSATDWMHATRKPKQGNTVAMYVTSGDVRELREICHKRSLGADPDLLDELREMPFAFMGIWPTNSASTGVFGAKLPGRSAERLMPSFVA